MAKWSFAQASGIYGATADSQDSSDTDAHSGRRGDDAAAADPSLICKFSWESVQPDTYTKQSHTLHTQFLPPLSVSAKQRNEPLPRVPQYSMVRLMASYTLSSSGR